MRGSFGGGNKMTRGGKRAASILILTLILGFLAGFSTAAQVDTAIEIITFPVNPVVGQSVAVTWRLTAQTGSLVVFSGDLTRRIDSPTGGGSWDVLDDTVATSGGSPFSTSSSFVPDQAGTYTIEGSYPACGGCAPPLYGSSKSTTLVVAQAATTTTVTLKTGSNNPSVTGEDVTFTATVAADAPGGGTPNGTGTVTFYADGTPFDSPQSLTAGVAEATTSFDAVDSPESITAVYSGDAANYIGSTSSAYTQIVDKASVVVTITSVTPSGGLAGDPSVVGQPYTVSGTLAVDPPGNGTPAGTVTVDDGEGHSGTDTSFSWNGTSWDWSCTVTPTTPLTVGVKTLTAVYVDDDDANVNYSTASSTASHTVNKANTSAAITSDLTTATVVGDSYTVSGTVTPAYGWDSASTTGTVQVSDGTDTCTDTTLTWDTANDRWDWSCSLVSTTVGTPKTITAVYSGDADYNDPASDPTASHTVNKANTSAAITSDLTTATVVGQPYTVSGTVTPAYGWDSASTSGSVQISDGADVCTDTTLTWDTVNDRWDWSCSLTSTAPGIKTLTAVYSGDTDYNGTSTTASHQVNKGTVLIGITPSNDPWNSGSSGMFTAAVTAVGPAAGSPTGTVTFHIKDVGGVTIDNSGPHLLSSGSASSNSVTLTSAQSTVSVKVTYSGDSNFAGSTTVDGDGTGTNSNSLDQTVTAPTPGAFTITSHTPDPTIMGNDITVNVGYSGGGFPDDGTVEVKIGYPTGTCDSTIAITSSYEGEPTAGPFVLGTSSIPQCVGGAWDITATYTPDTGPVETDTVSHTLYRCPAPTTTVSLDPGTVYVNQPTTITATVTTTAASPCDVAGLIGTAVDFATKNLPAGADGDFSSDYCTLVSGGVNAYCSNVTYTPISSGADCTSSATQGHIILATSSDPSWLESSGQATLTVAKRPPVVSVVCDPDSVYIDQETTCTITVSDGTVASGSTIPTGAATFDNDGAAGAFSPSDSGSLVHGTFDVTYTPAAGDAGTSVATTTIGADYGGSSIYCVGDSTAALEVKVRPTETTLSWQDSDGGNDAIYLYETGTVIVTVTDIGPADSASPPEGTLTVTGPMSLVSGLSAVSSNASQATYNFTKYTSTESHTFVGVTATYVPSTSSPLQTHDGSSGSVDVSVQKRETETELDCQNQVDGNCTVTVTDTASRGTAPRPAGDAVDQADSSVFCSLTTGSGTSNECTNQVIGDSMMQPFSVAYEPDDNIHVGSYAMYLIERPLVPDTGDCGTLHIEDTIFGLNTTCTVMAALQVLLDSGAAAASIIADPVWTAIFPGSTVPIGDMIAAGLTGLSLHGEIAIQTMCTDVDGDGIPGSVEAVIAGLEDHKWDSDSDGMGDLDEIDEANGDMATSYSASKHSTCACPNPTVSDSDGDDIKDGNEQGNYVTDFCKYDTDGDGLSDSQEVGTFSAYPSDSGANTILTVRGDARDHADPKAVDTDGDGLDDLVEFAEGSVYPDTDPYSTFVNDPDSDGDGLLDGVEDQDGSGSTTYTLGGTGTQGSGETHPCIPDTDGDGLMDGEEEGLFGRDGTTGIEVVTPSGTDTVPALDDDSDDDGLSDYEEVHTTQTDPLHWDTDGDTIGDAAELIVLSGSFPDRMFDQESNPLDQDTDHDGLLDNIEYSGTGVTRYSSESSNPGTRDLICPYVSNDDSDDDGLQDGTESWNGDGAITTLTIGNSTSQATVGPPTGETDFCEPDTDGDGLTDGEEVALLGGLPVDSVDGFTPVIPRRVSITFGVDVPLNSADATIPALDDDSDNDGLSDYEEVNVTGTDPLDADSDNDTLSDANELIATGGTWPNRTFIQESDPLDPDTDDDDLHDYIEYPGSGLGLSRSTGGIPDNACPYVNDDDSDDDGLQDGVEDANHDGTWGLSGSGMTLGGFSGPPTKAGGAFYWETDLCNPDTDGDGLLDGEEVGQLGGEPVFERPKGVGETFSTVSFEMVSTTLPEGTNTVPSGYTHSAPSPGTGDNDIAPYTFTPVKGDAATLPTVPALDVDSDDDGLSDYEEVNITGTDPLDQDSDNDTLKDADELIATGGVTGTTPRRTFDQESDPLDINTDDDGLFDPQEYAGSGLSTADGAAPAGTRDAVCPLVNNDDSDDDGIQDGVVVTITPAGVITSTGAQYSYTHYEDFIDLNAADEAHPGTVRTVPTSGHGEQQDDNDWDVCDSDSDGDGLNDGEEIAIGTNPDDWDTDDDGRNDWHEVTGGGPIPTDPFDPDTDDDGLLDSAEVFGSNNTNPLNADTDGDGLCDGGTRTPWMILLPLDARVVVNPICKSCATPVAVAAGTTPCATPLTRLGSPDGIGDHPNPIGIGEDESGNGGWEPTLLLGGETDPNQYDTDGDGLADGIERLSFSTTRQQMIPTVDLFGRPITVVYPEANNTKQDCGCLNPLDPDSDDDGLSDGYEDANHDGNFDFLPSDFEYEQVPLPGPPQPNPNETNPCDPDTDHDELTDWEERVQRQPFAEYFDPLPIDNDGDGAFDEDPIDGIDNDLDGETDEDPTEEPIELTFNPTNPLDHDTDNDRIYDGPEVKWVCTPLTCSQLDNDTDAAINEDPVDGIDNDEDGLLDEDPVDFTIRFVPMLDPTNRDSDSDGYLDGLDDDPCNSECIPAVLPPMILPVDTDGDGFSDDSELAAGTHPNDPEDHPIAFCNVDLDFDQWMDDRIWLEPSICCGIANSAVIDIDSNVLIDFRLQIVQPRDVRTGDFDGDGAEDDMRYIVEYAFANYRVLQPRIVATIDDYDADLVIDWVVVERK